jgi:hypothetical protein
MTEKFCAHCGDGPSRAAPTTPIGGVWWHPKCHDRCERTEWSQIKKFATACRRQWPGAMIVLRPDTRCEAGQQ